MKRKVCPRCNTLNDPEYQFCRKCGQDISNIQPYETHDAAPGITEPAYTAIDKAGAVITGVRPEEKYAHARARIRKMRAGAKILRVVGWLLGIVILIAGIAIGGSLAQESPGINDIYSSHTRQSGRGGGATAGFFGGLLIGAIVIMLTENAFSLKMMYLDLTESNLDIEENTRQTLEVLRFQSNK